MEGVLEKQKVASRRRVGRSWHFPARAAKRGNLLAEEQ